MREPAKASATMAGASAFIAQVRSSCPADPNLRPAMNTTLASLGSASISLRSSRSASMHSTPHPASFSRVPFSLKRATPTTRLSGAARLARRASVGPIFPPTPSTMMSPGSCCHAAVKAADGVVITSSRCSTSRKRSGNASADWLTRDSLEWQRSRHCRMLAARPFSQQARAAGKTCPATYNRRSEETETAMKVFMFHLMPYAYLDMSFSDKYRSAWVVLPNTYFDPNKGHELYNRYLDALALDADLGFDGICVNEHHQNAYGLMPSPVVMAAALSRRTKNAKIAILGNAFCLREHPLTLAEEHAMLDCITGGRLISGMVRGIGAEYYSIGSNPAFSHARFQEAHDLVIEAWTRPGPFAFEGKFYHFEYVNVWTRTYQQQNPPLWTPSAGPSERK